MKYTTSNAFAQYSQVLGPVSGKPTYRTVIAEYRQGTVQLAAYGRTLKYWACAKGRPKAVEFDTQAMAVAYLHRGCFS